MEAFCFEGEYEDGAGREAIAWRTVPVNEPGTPRFRFETVIRGTDFDGFDIDSLEPHDRQQAISAGFSLQSTGDLHECVLRGDLPCSVSAAGQVLRETLTFALDLRNVGSLDRAAPRNLTLSISVHGVTYSVVDEWFDSGLEQLQDQLSPGLGLMCCHTCQYSDYSPLGHGLIGMRCHRDAKAEYFAVKSKRDYWSVPVTEDVMESYLCAQYQPRVPGTGHRG